MQVEDNRKPITAEFSSIRQGGVFKYLNQPYMVVKDEGETNAAQLTTGDACTFKPHDVVELLPTARLLID